MKKPFGTMILVWNGSYLIRDSQQKNHPYISVKISKEDIAWKRSTRIGHKNSNSSIKK